jgi:hypothetical protein
MTSHAEIPKSDAEAWRSWWIFYIDPTQPQCSGWKTAGSISGPYTADEAIAQTVGRMFDQPFWAFALDKGETGSYYDLHYPVGRERPEGRRIGPSGYVALSRASSTSRGTGEGDAAR